MAVKNPLCNYSGDIKELQSGDTIVSSGTATNPVIYEYIANGTWTKPTASNFWGAMFVCIGAGGGGGSGRLGAVSTARGGGGGGQGGAAFYYFFRASVLVDAVYNIVIGSGGAGAAGQTTSSTNGIAGSTGGSTIITGTSGVLLSADGGRFGNPGSTALSGISEAVPSGTPGGLNTLPIRTLGGRGGSSVTTIINASAPLQRITCGGGGGSGSTASNIDTNAAPPGALIILPNGNTIAGGTGGITTGLPAARNGGNGTLDALKNMLFDIDVQTTYGVGTGGGGGATGDNGSANNGGNGGAGGRCAGGGGGGGATNSPGLASGAGGNGGGGLCFVIEYYGA